MKLDKRMYLLRNMKSLKDTSVEYEINSFNVFSDSIIEGEFDNGFYKISSDGLSFKNGVFKTFLTIKTKEKKVHYVHPHHDREVYTKKGFYHGGTVTDELLELSSLFLRRRIVRQNGIISYSMKEFLKRYGVEGWADESLIIGKSNLNELYHWFDLIEGLKEEYHLKFLFATKMYCNAISIIEEKPDIAYLYLVSAIEVFLKDFEIETTIEDLTVNNTKLKTILESIDDLNLKRDIEEQMLKMNDFISKKFVKFIMQYTENDFWDRGEFPQDMDNQEILEEVRCFVERKELVDRETLIINKETKKLKGILSKIYNERSSFLHGGEPFQPIIFGLIEPGSKKEIPRYLYLKSGNRKWEYHDYIPYPHFFERLVNHVLKNFLIKNQKD